jgi:hypothetical protein
MQNARSTAAISRASEGYHFSHDALVTCKLPIIMLFVCPGGDELILTKVLTCKIQSYLL